jgi:hypothetical protein
MRHAGVESGQGWPTRVCGFLIVRRPHENYDLTGRGVFTARPAKSGDTYYGGVGRMPWFDLDELYYGPRPAEPVVAFKRRLTQLNPDVTGVALVPELKDVSQCLQLLGGLAAANEVVAVHSEALARTKGLVPVDNPGAGLGLDVVVHGGGSLLREGLFGSEFFGREWGQRLNPHGLFPSRAGCEAFCEEYRRGASQGRLEAVGLGKVDFIDLYRLSIAPLFQVPLIP